LSNTKLLLLGTASIIACQSALRQRSTGNPERRQSMSVFPDSSSFELAPVRTDSLTYHLVRSQGSYDAWAVATYVNRTGHPVHYARCTARSQLPMAALVRSTPSTRRSVVGGTPLCVGGVPTGFIPPDEAVSVRVWLGSANSSLASPPVVREQRTGRFRILLALCESAGSDASTCRYLPQHERQSNEFDVELDDQ
jgi:hypothetical protein